MIKYVNGQEVSWNNSVKVRSHPEATANDFIDYVQPTDRQKSGNYSYWIKWYTE